MMGITATVFFLLLCQVGISVKTCTDCEVWNNENQICVLSTNCTVDCKAGYYGENCTEECVNNCLTCVNGTECNKCKPGYYTAMCNKPCGKGCGNNTCLISGECSCKSTNFINGTCENCSGNKYGDECNKTCPRNCISCISDTVCTLCADSMFYGSYCQYSCSIGCKEGICDKSDGHCTDGCKPGWHGTYCKLLCGKGCVNDTCSQFTGDCICKSQNFTKHKCDACSGLTYGDSCNNTCPSNCSSCISESECSVCYNNVYYGSYCQYRCSHGCSRGKCDKVTGYCTQGCKPNFRGNKCDICSQGLYGKYCDLFCPENCSSCISEANCTECKIGLYGKTCTNTCPFGCYENCSSIDGRCIECKPDLFGEFCNNTCKDGTFGVNCSKSCRDIDNHCNVCSAYESGIYEGCTKCDRGFYPISPQRQNNSICTRCPKNCNGNICDTIGLCINGCVQGKWGNNCSDDCGTNCVVCSQSDGKCFECTNDTFSVDCSQNCSTNCSFIHNGRICERDSGSCLRGCTSTIAYGDYCEKLCSDTCNNQSCNWTSGHCSDGCSINYYGLFCNKTCSTSCLSNGRKRICDENTGYCLYGCKDRFHGSRCDSQCSSQCINTTCNQITAECLHGCTDGYEGQKCVLAIKGAESEGKKSLVIIAGSAGAGVAVIVLLVILVICLNNRNRRQKLSSNTTCEENDYVLDMKEIPKQIDQDEPGDIYAKPFKPKQEAGGDAGKEYDTTYDDDKKIPAIDNGYTAVNIETSANEKSKSFEVCDIAHDNKPLNGNNDYAVVNKGKSTVKENECFEEVYDTTHDNKKNKQPLSSNNDYAVLSVRSDNTKGFGKSNLAQQDDVYDSLEGGKHKTMPRPSNDYAVFNSNNGDNHGNDKANTLYDTATDKKMRPGNNDYDFCELDTD